MGLYTSQILDRQNKGGPARTRSFLLPDDRMNHCSADDAGNGDWTLQRF
jgi:hypothetical protein